MPHLSEAIRSLIEFLESQGHPPPTDLVRVVEIRPDARADTLGRLHVSSDDLRDPVQYEARFEELVTSGLPWVNVSCYGMHDGKLIVAIELPRSASKASTATSINYSGPTALALRKEWICEDVLVVD